WFEYKAEVDALRAPDELKEKLRAMKTAAPAAKPAAKKAVRFPLKRLAGMAACFVCGGVAMLALAGAGGIGMGGMSYFAEASQNTAAIAPGAAAGGSTDAKGTADLMFDSFTTESWVDGSLAENGVNQPVAGTELKSQTSDGTQRSAAARKIIYTAVIALESTTYDETLQQLHQALQVAGGYIEHSANSGYGTDHRRVSYTLRVPVEHYHSFLAQAEAGGNLVKKVEDSQDITAAYVDVAARIDTLTTQRDRLQQLSAQAETLTDLLDIEDKLSDVQYELESYQRQLKIYDDQVAYCTIEATVQEVTNYTPVQPTTAERLLNALTGGFENFADTLFDLALWVLRNLSWLIILTVCGGVGLRIWKKRKL
ncbi:MAG: DUF4349 domain-containing protein, partial [Faecalibacterium sp.]|nr:DUF4349 domain-containing protein [Faecalibacterium sp.]